MSMSAAEAEAWQRSKQVRTNIKFYELPESLQRNPAACTNVSATDLKAPSQVFKFSGGHPQHSVPLGNSNAETAAGALGVNILGGQMGVPAMSDEQNFWNWTIFPGVMFNADSDYSRNRSSALSGNIVAVAGYILIVSKQRPDFISANAYKEVSIARPGTGMQERLFQLDVRFLRVDASTMAAIISAVNGVNADGMYISVFPAVNEADLENRTKMFEEQLGMTMYDAWSVSGPSLGLALAAALSNAASVGYTGFLPQLARDTTLAAGAGKGLAETLAGAAIVENIRYADYKAAWACAVGCPLVIPLSDSYEVDLAKMLMDVGMRMIQYGPKSNPQRSALARMENLPMNSMEHASKLATTASSTGYLFHMRKNIYSMQDVEMKLPFVSHGSYILAAKNLIGARTLAFLANCCVSFSTISASKPSQYASQLNASVKASANQDILQLQAENTFAKRAAAKARRPRAKRSAPGTKTSRVTKKRAKASKKSASSAKKVQDALDALRSAGVTIGAPTRQGTADYQRAMPAQMPPPPNIDDIFGTDEGAAPPAWSGETLPPGYVDSGVKRKALQQADTASPAAQAKLQLKLRDDKLKRKGTGKASKSSNISSKRAQQQAELDELLAQIPENAQQAVAAGIMSVPLAERQAAVQELANADWDAIAQAEPSTVGARVYNMLRNRRRQQQQGQAQGAGTFGAGLFSDIGGLVGGVADTLL
jgi:hypothetical protein